MHATFKTVLLVPAHPALSIRQFLADEQIPVVPHPLWFVFSLFPKITTNLEVQRFDDIVTKKRGGSTLILNRFKEMGYVQDIWR